MAGTQVVRGLLGVCALFQTAREIGLQVEIAEIAEIAEIVELFESVEIFATVETVAIVAIVEIVEIVGIDEIAVILQLHLSPNNRLELDRVASFHTSQSVKYARTI
jgi:hypothetical protein